MKNYILLYAYTIFSEEETNFWNDVNVCFRKQGYDLYLLAPTKPKFEINFPFSIFVEKLDNVNIKDPFVPILKNYEYDFILQREEVWYGTGKSSRLDKAKFQHFLYSELIRELNPSILVLANGNHSSELLLNDIVKTAGISTIFFERGCLPGSWHIDQLGITAGSSIALNSNIPKFKNKISQDFYEIYKKRYLNKKQTWWKQPENTSILDLRKRFNISSNTKIILFANQLDNDTSNFLYSPYFETNYEAIEWFYESLNYLELDCFLLIKKHPWYKGSSDFNLIFNSNIRGAFVDDLDLFECLNQSDLFCAVNSTAIYESMIYKVPVLQLGQSILSNKDIVYELKGTRDMETIINWFEQKDYTLKLNKYQYFISYMINYELAFMDEYLVDQGFNGSGFFAETILSYITEKRSGSLPYSYSNFRYSQFNDISKDNIVRKLFNKFFKIMFK